jgi:hypothetical protein
MLTLAAGIASIGWTGAWTLLLLLAAQGPGAAPSLVWVLPLGLALFQALYACRNAWAVLRGNGEQRARARAQLTGLAWLGLAGPLGILAARNELGGDGWLAGVLVASLPMITAALCGVTASRLEKPSGAAQRQATH